MRCVLGLWLYFAASYGAENVFHRGIAFEHYPIGYFHIDLAEVRTAEGKLYLFVAIDRTSKFAFVKLVERADMRAAVAFLQALIAAVPYRIHTVLTDNGIQFADLPKNRKGPTACFRGHPFDSAGQQRYGGSRSCLQLLE
jgi:hypothetical protein